jgi:2-dehydropantoate 2-reductase
MAERLRILVVGAGAVGGYFGARLAAAGEDVTFLVREGRYRELSERGLEVESVHGSLHLRPRLVTRKDPGVYDVLILAVKQYHTEEVFAQIAPFMGPESVILPLLNGVSHVEVLQERYGKERVLGGLCQIEVTLNEGKVVHTSPFHSVTLGALHPGKDAVIEALAEAFRRAGVSVQVSADIEADMWRKWMFISAFSGVTTLTRRPIGPILETEAGARLFKNLLQEVKTLAEAYGVAVTPEDVENYFEHTCRRISKEMMSSMSRDLLKGLPLELDAIQGTVIEFARRKGMRVPYHETVYAGLCLYKDGNR